jgi:hypothetical protein
MAQFMKVAGVEEATCTECGVPEGLSHRETCEAFGEFTPEDCRDVVCVLQALNARVLDEFSDSQALKYMFKPYQEYIVRAAMIGDQSFGQLLPSDPLDYDESDRKEVELQQACKRILGSGRFDYFDEAEDEMPRVHDGQHAVSHPAVQRGVRQSSGEQGLGGGANSVPQAVHAG